MSLSEKYDGTGLTKPLGVVALRRKVRPIEEGVINIGLPNPIIIYNDDNAKPAVSLIFMSIYQLDYHTASTLANSYR